MMTSAATSATMTRLRIWFCLTRFHLASPGNSIPVTQLTRQGPLGLSKVTSSLAYPEKCSKADWKLRYHSACLAATRRWSTQNTQAGNQAQNDVTPLHKRLPGFGISEVPVPQSTRPRIKKPQRHGLDGFGASWAGCLWVFPNSLVAFHAAGISNLMSTRLCRNMRSLEISL